MTQHVFRFISLQLNTNLIFYLLIWLTRTDPVFITKSAFNWTGLHTVANVSKPGYDRCVKRGSIQRSSPAKIALSSGGNHFFICTIDSHCQRGQKLSVAVAGRAGRYLPTVFGPFLAVVSAILLHSLSFHGWMIKVSCSRRYIFLWSSVIVIVFWFGSTML